MLEETVESVNTAADREIDGAVAEVDNEPTLDAWVDLLHDLDALALRGVLGALEGRFETGRDVLVEGLRSVNRGLASHVRHHSQQHWSPQLPLLHGVHS